jgi:hypothetical protein
MKFKAFFIFHKKPTFFEDAKSLAKSAITSKTPHGIRLAIIFYNFVLLYRVDPDLALGLAYGEDTESADRRAERLGQARAKDCSLGWTSIGPHRARVSCRIQGRELNDGASRGFARLYSILVRLALAGVLDERLGEPPIVLLDDPESELDPRWIGKLLALVPDGSQAIVTACRPLTMSPDRFRAIPIDSLEVGEALAVGGSAS